METNPMDTPNREEELLKRAAQLEETIRRGTEAANKLSGGETGTTSAGSEEAGTIPPPSGAAATLEEPLSPENPGERVVAQDILLSLEIQNMPEGDREKLGWGLGVIGYRVEKMKDDFFAKTLRGRDKKNG